MSQIKLENFEGPLDLLLQLVDQQELDITEVSLSQITEQYFQYLDKLEKNRSEKLADFLVIATRLIFLKSKHLLPHLYPEQEEDGPTLADQLKMYKAYVEASKNIEQLWSSRDLSYERTEPPKKIKEFVLPLNSTVSDLEKSFDVLLKRLKPISALPTASIDHTISIKQTVDRIRDLLKNNKKLSFKKLLSQSKNRTEVIVNFLALLELVGHKTAAVQQNSSYADLEITSN